VNNSTDVVVVTTVIDQVLGTLEDDGTATSPIDELALDQVAVGTRRQRVITGV
jgi:hypothetical protein